MESNYTRTRFCLFSLLLWLCCNTFAIPAFPYKVFVQTNNGKRVGIYMKGDEFMKYALTEDGYTILSDSVGWWYATMDSNGKTIKTKFALTCIEDESDELKDFKKSTPKGFIPDKPSTLFRKSYGETSNGNNTEPLIGERRALVILMQYQDFDFKTSKEDFDQLFNTLGYTKNNATGSVRDFYRFASQGQLNYISDIYGPYTSRHPMRYYGRNVASSGGDANPIELCIEAIRSLPANFDFSIYDNNKDGLVDNVHIIYAGYGEEAGASADAIWAHEYPHKIALGNEVGYSFASYSCSPELHGNNGKDITNIGVICHELGHALGAMDFYDTNYGKEGEYVGTGNWDIMAGGSWNNHGNTPPNFNPYVRSNVFKWNSQILLEEDRYISLPQMESNNPEQSIVYRINTEVAGDYFLIENRQKHLFDSAIPGEGLMIYHVHPDIDTRQATNTINSTSPQCLYPVCATYSEPSKKRYGNINSTECPFPGSGNVTTFSQITSPAAVAWNGSPSEVSISDIEANEWDGSVSFYVNSDTERPGLSSDSIVIYQESFENNADERLIINSIFGKNSWRVYAKGELNFNTNTMPEPTDGAKILMLCANKNSPISESEVISQSISIIPHKDYTLSFDIYSTTNSASQPIFKLYIEEEIGKREVYELEEVNNSWSRVVLPLEFTSDAFKYRLYGKIYNAGVFIDNIQLSTSDYETSISHSKIQDNNPPDIYSITGLKYSTIKKGINVIHNSNGETKLIIL